MAKFKIEKNSNYTVMSNYHLRDKKLSYKAKGLLSFMLSLPDNWDYSINGLVSTVDEIVESTICIPLPAISLSCFKPTKVSI